MIRHKLLLSYLSYEDIYVKHMKQPVLPLLDGFIISSQEFIYLIR